MRVIPLTQHLGSLVDFDMESLLSIQEEENITSLTESFLRGGWSGTPDRRLALIKQPDCLGGGVSVL